MAKYDNVTVRLVGEDGNAFVILGTVLRELERAGVSQSERKRYEAEATAGDYDNFIRVTCDWVYVPFTDSILDDDWEEPYSDDWDDYDEDYYNEDDLKYEGRSEDDYSW